MTEQMTEDELADVLKAKAEARVEATRAMHEQEQSSPLTKSMGCKRDRHR